MLWPIVGGVVGIGFVRFVDDLSSAATPFLGGVFVLSHKTE